jgi:hypothetical protein
VCFRCLAGVYQAELGEDLTHVHRPACAFVRGAPQNLQADSEASVWRLHHWHWTFFGTSGSGEAVMFVMLVT